MNQRSALVSIVVGIGVFYALLTGDFVIILMSVVAGYVIQTLLGWPHLIFPVRAPRPHWLCARVFLTDTVLNNRCIGRASNSFYLNKESGSAVNASN